MALVALIALGLFFTTFSWKVWPDADSDATRLAALLATALLAVGAAAHHPALAAFFVWAALHVAWTRLGAEKKVLRGNCPADMQLRGQQCILMAGAAYIGLTSVLDPPRMLPWTALACVVWALYNAGCAAWQYFRMPLPASWHRSCVNDPVEGLVGFAPQLAWLMGAAALSATYLARAWHPAAWLAIAPLAVAAWMSRNTSGPGAALVAGSLLYLPWSYVAPTVAVAAAGAWTWGPVRLSFWSRLDVWYGGWQVARHNRFWGSGLGFWKMIEFQTESEKARQVPYAWHEMHNDWVQSLVEMGPVPALCGLWFLASTWHGLPGTAHALYAFSLVLYTALYALTYFPFHMPGQALVCVIGLAALGARG